MFFHKSREPKLFRWVGTSQKMIPKLFRKKKKSNNLSAKTVVKSEDHPADLLVACRLHMLKGELRY